MGKILVGDRVKIVLKQPYTEEEIRIAGCHPGVDGKTGKVISVEHNYSGVKFYHIQLDKKLAPHELHVNTEYDEMFDDYCETEENVELYFEDSVKTNYVFLKPINVNAYRRLDCDIPAITGLFHVEPDGLRGRLCYEVTYEDGFVDYIPKSDVDNGEYQFIVQ